MLRCALLFATLVAAAALRPTPPPPLATRRGALALATLAAAAAAAPPRAACAKSDFKWGPMARMSEASGLHALHALHMAAPLDAPSMLPRCALAAPSLHIGCTTTALLHCRHLARAQPMCSQCAANVPRHRRTTTALLHRRRTLTQAEMDGLDARSREPDAGVLLPGGVRVIDMVVGDGPAPAEGQRIYAHYKVWADGFRAGGVADWSFYDDRPYDWVLQHAQSAPLARPQLGCCASSGHAWRLWAARHSQEEAVPLDAQPVPRQ